MPGEPLTTFLPTPWRFTWSSDSQAGGPGNRTWMLVADDGRFIASFGTTPPGAECPDLIRRLGEGLAELGNAATLPPVAPAIPYDLEYHAAHEGVPVVDLAPDLDVETLIGALRAVDERIVAEYPEHAVELLDGDEKGRRDYAGAILAEYRRLRADKGGG